MKVPAASLVLPSPCPPCFPKFCDEGLAGSGRSVVVSVDC